MAARVPHVSVPASHWKEVSVQRMVVTGSGLFHMCLVGTHSVMRERKPSPVV